MVDDTLTCQKRRFLENQDRRSGSTIGDQGSSEITNNTITEIFDRPAQLLLLLLFRLIYIARFVYYKSLSICFQGTKYETFRERFCYLHSIW